MLLALTTAYEKARQAGLRPLGYRDFEHLAQPLDRVLAWGAQLLPQNSHPDVPERESLLYLGINYADLVERLGEEGAARHYAEHGRHGFLPLSFMRKVLAELRPDAVVATNSPRTEEAAIAAAVAMGIPVLSMVDLFAMPFDKYRQRTIHADRITVINDFARANLIEAGFDARRIAVTGNPAFDTLADPRIRCAADEFLAARGWGGKKVVLLAPHLEQQPGTPAHWAGPGLGLEAERILRAWVAAGDDRALIVRHHPSQLHLFEDLGAHPRVHRSDPQREPLHPVLLASQVVLVQTTTVGLEAALCGRSLLCLTYSPTVDPRWSYVAQGLAQPVEDPAQLVPAVERALAAHRERGTAPGFNIGGATRAVADEVMALLGRRD